MIAQVEEEPEQYSGDWWMEILLDIPLKVVGLIVLAFITRYVLHKLINRMVHRAETTRPPERMLGSRQAARIVFGSTGAYSERRALRARTLGSLAKSVVTAVIGAVAVVMILAQFGYNVAPLLASAGIAGIALGFGAQNLVKDFLSGVMMLLEDQYGVGDVIDMGEAAGTVEAVGLRVTRLRSVDGTVWYVRNGEVVRVGNSSQDWARAVIDIGVSYGADPGRVRELLTDVSHELAGDPEWGPLILEEPEVWGVENLAADGVVVRLVVKTKPLQQWSVARQLRERIKVRFDAEGIEIPNPQRTVWIRGDESRSAEG
ncbi:MAG TPA: mechanosensitive ion channel family protein [Jiangellaceae bacterium]|nr:mechanosensitive ion channel family protein [Jiangellaceae bacterium]